MRPWLIPFACAGLLMLAPASHASRGDEIPIPFYADPIREVHADVTYDLAYLLDGLAQLRERILALEELDDSSRANVEEITSQLQELGVQYLDSARQETRIDDAGYYERVTVTLSPAGRETPLGALLNLEGSDTALPYKLDPDNYLFFMTLSHPDAWLATVAEMDIEQANTALLEEIARETGMPPEVGMGMEGMGAMLDRMVEVGTELFAGVEAVHLGVFHADIDTFEVDAAVILEYPESSAAFEEFMFDANEKHGLGFAAAANEGGTPWILQPNADMPLPLTWIAQGRFGVLATNPDTALETIDWAETKPKDAQKPPKEGTLGLMRANLQAIRDFIPEWGLGMAASAVEDEMAGELEGFEFRDLLDYPLGEMTLRRLDTPNALTVEFEMDRAAVHVAYKLYERVMVASLLEGMIQEARSAQRMEAIGQAELVNDAMARYFEKEGRYPESLMALLETGHLAEQPMNVFADRPMAEVAWQDRVAGDITFTPLTDTIDGHVVGLQLLLYGPAEWEDDWVDNDLRGPYGNFFEFADGTPDMVLWVASEPYELLEGMSDLYWELKYPPTEDEWSEEEPSWMVGDEEALEDADGIEGDSEGEEPDSPETEPGPEV